MYTLPFKSTNELTKEIHKTQNVFPTIFIKIIMEVSFSKFIRVTHVNSFLYLCIRKFELFSSGRIFLKFSSLLSPPGSQ